MLYLNFIQTALKMKSWILFCCFCKMIMLTNAFSCWSNKYLNDWEDLQNQEAFKVKCKEGVTSCFKLIIYRRNVAETVVGTLPRSAVKLGCNVGRNGKLNVNLEELCKEHEEISRRRYGGIKFNVSVPVISHYISDQLLCHEEYCNELKGGEVVRTFEAKIRWNAKQDEEQKKDEEREKKRKEEFARRAPRTVSCRMAYNRLDLMENWELLKGYGYRKHRCYNKEKWCASTTFTKGWEEATFFQCTNKNEEELRIQAAAAQNSNGASKFTVFRCGTNYCTEREKSMAQPVVVMAVLVVGIVIFALTAIGLGVGLCCFCQKKNNESMISNRNNKNENRKHPNKKKYQEVPNNEVEAMSDETP